MTAWCIAAVLLAQGAPLLEEAGGCELSIKEQPLLIPSRSGRWLAVLTSQEIQILEADSFKPVKRLAGPVSTAGFDAGDAMLTVVGRSFRQFDTKEWKERRAIDLPDADPPSPGFALVLKEGQAWYRNRDGWITAAWMDGMEWKRKPLEPPAGASREPVVRFWADAGAGILVSTAPQRRAGGMVIDGAFAEFPLAEQTIAAGSTRGAIVIVTRTAAAVFSPPSWKCTWRGEGENRAAAVDETSGTVFISRAEGLHAFDERRPEKFWTYERVTEPFTGLTVDASGRRLYGVAGSKIRCWTIKPSK